MDGAGLLVVLAIVVAVDAIATVTLLVLTIRERRARRHSEADPDRGRAARPAGSGPATTPSAATGDPLAGAISAFLQRREGVFTAGVVAEAGQGPPVAAAGAQPVAPPGGILAGPAVGQPVELVVPTLRQPPARPARYVPSGPIARPPAVPAATAWSAFPHEPVAAPEIPAQPWPEQPFPVQPRYRPASRLSVALAGRDGSRPEATGAAITRLGPVIGGLLRERTRARDRVAEEGPGRFVVVLPETQLDGAEALGHRLRSTCDAWLGAETPPLGLDLEAAELPGGVPGGFPEPESGRASGPERRRPLPLET